MRTRVLEYAVDISGQTLLEFLKEKGFSRHILRSMKPYPDAVRRNGAGIYMREELHAGDHLQIVLREETGSEGIVPAPVPFLVVYEDEDILVADKPPNTPVHPSLGNYENTLANGVAYYFARKGESIVFRCINRLDRDTSGLLIIAKHALSAACLSKEMREGKIRRTYIALAEGKTEPEGVIDLPIGRKEGSLMERCVDPVNGERAVTRYRRLAYFPDLPENPDFQEAGDTGMEDRPRDFSCLELHLETGRTHQIRVHMAAAGHPLLGDTMYGAGRGMSRQALHSARLEFDHPVTGKHLDFSSELPEDFPEIKKILLKISPKGIKV